MSTDTLVLSVTDTARDRVLELRGAEPSPESLALRVEVVGTHGAEYRYDLTFQPLDELDEGDHLSEQEGLPVVVPAESIDSLRGATLDLPLIGPDAGLVLRNPNRPSLLGSGGDLELTGTLEEKVMTMLVERVNPALASHGGFAELVGIEGDVVKITMGGGCQGCSMSRMTLTDGITTMLKDAIPEITEVVDVTDHSVGENPYFN